MSTGHVENYESLNAVQESATSDDFTPARYRQFARHFPKSVEKVLDVGCSTGRGGVVIAELLPGLSLSGLDCVAERIGKLPPCYDTAYRCVTTAIPLPDRTFDVVVAGEFLEHLRPHDVDASICEFQRVLRVGGRLLMTTPNPAYLRNRLRGHSVLGSVHLTQHHANVLRARLRAAGFARVRIRGSGRVSRYLGERFPMRSLYGSYLIWADKI